MNKRVIILGGGVGGMSAAHELVERGFEVEVHEPKPIPGGKARTIYVPGTGVGGRPDLPGEHGFRFFPSFYKHLPDTMKRIPYQGKPNGVYDNLVQATQYLLASTPASDPVFLVKFPITPEEWREAIMGLFAARELGIPRDELAYFADRLFVILTSCQERRLAEYEKISWWDFISAERMSEPYQRYLATGLTRSLVAMRAEEGSTRTVGDILIQLLLGLISPLDKFDRVLDGPTSEVWLQPWLDYLTSRGARFVFGSTAVAIHCIGERITGVLVRDEAGNERLVTGDYYVSAMPVERLHPLVTSDMIAADPALGRLGELRVAWMNGFQFFLKRDVPMVHGHANYVTTPWALTSISQAQFWNGGLERYGDGTVRGCLSIDISDWETPGIVFGKSGREVPNREDVKIEVTAQLRASLREELAAIVDEANVHSWFLDPDIVLPNPDGATVNLEPLLINTTDSWRARPEAHGRIENFFLAADFVRTNTDLATMEGANEAARRAVNAILARSGSRAEPCHVWPLEEPAIFFPLRAYDLLRFELGLPHVRFETELPASSVRAPEAPSPSGGASPDDVTAHSVRKTITHAVTDIVGEMAARVPR
jgi:uncharacterized protein with NAD-binding domain and iron-sulfur cluster